MSRHDLSSSTVREPHPQEFVQLALGDREEFVIPSYTDPTPSGRFAWLLQWSGPFDGVEATVTFDFYYAEAW